MRTMAAAILALALAACQGSGPETPAVSEEPATIARCKGCALDLPHTALCRACALCESCDSCFKACITCKGEVRGARLCHRDGRCRSCDECSK